MTKTFCALLVGFTVCTFACSGDGGGSSSSVGRAIAPAPVEAAGLRFELPGAWQATAPSSSMRAAQAVIPGAAGPAELAVFHFGAGQGGGIEANLQRWVSQIELDAGSRPQREFFETNGLAVTIIEITGTLRPGRMGMGPKEPQPNSILLGAVVEGPGGPWFFKATGPEATLRPQRDQFIAMLKAARPPA
jgi:hypothetical protein